jgi:DUF305 family protein family protein
MIHSTLRFVGMPLRVRHLVAIAALFSTATTWAAGPAAPVAPAVSNSAEAAFLVENDTAMSNMMDHMTIKPSGDVDRDFVAMMVPHHQGAIDMAQAELRHGKNEQLRRIAQEIVVEQQQEIVAMRLALGQTLPPSAPAPDQAKPQSSADGLPSLQHHHNMNDMNNMNMRQEP